MPARADDELDAALRRKQALERAVEVTRQHAERYQAAAGQYQSAVNAANARIADLAAQQMSAQSEGDALGFEIKIAEEQLQLVSFQLDETRALVDSLRAQGDELDRQLARRQELYADHLRAAYRQVQVTPLEMLLSSSSLTEFSSRLQATVLLNRQDAQLAADIQGLRAATARQQRDLAGKQTEIFGLQDQITTQRERLAMEKARYDELVRQADAAITTQASLRADAATNKSQAQRNAQQAAAEAARLNKQLEEAEALYEELAARLAARSGLGAFDGQHVALWPVRGTLTSPFGARWGGFHNGLDIAAAKYTPVRAVSSGLVVTVGRPYVAYGDTAVVVIIAHGSNFSTLYGHLDDRRWPPVQVGQKVNAGDVIGYVGMTGWTTGPHLHFMTIANGRARNPLPYLP
ncbi:MAG: peptidoglycan DD-metalloendopeptidase family protein [Candidatus Limnocylindria bacterium]|nr:peptidoglycan DD-metalloendopeptidase family protein [Candidatus Limnocylindria bacterium]